jgi:hypothetical protein
LYVSLWMMESRSSRWFNGIATFSWMALCKSVIQAIFLLVESGGNSSVNDLKTLKCVTFFTCIWIKTHLKFHVGKCH